MNVYNVILFEICSYYWSYLHTESINNSSKGTTNPWTNHWDPKIKIVGGKDSRTVDTGSEQSKNSWILSHEKVWIIPWSEITSRVQRKSAVVSESKADNSDAHSNEDWNDSTSDLIFRISHSQNWNYQNKGSDDLVKAKNMSDI